MTSADAVRYAVRADDPCGELNRYACTFTWALCACIALVAFGGCPKRPSKMSALPAVVTDDPEAERAMRMAREAAAEGRTSEAEQRYLDVLRQFPNDPLMAVANLGLGRIELSSERVDAAQQRFIALMEHPDRSIAERAAFYSGIANHLEERHQAALNALLPFVDRVIDPDEVTLLLLTIADAALQLGERVIAIQALDRLSYSVAHESERYEARERVSQMIPEASLEELITLHESLPRQGSAWPIASKQLAIKELRAGHRSEALRIIDQLESHAPLDESVSRLRTQAEETHPARSHVIGAILPLSGRARGVGQLALRGLMLAAEASRQGSTERGASEVIFRDDASDPERAEKAVEDLVSLHQVIAIVGPIEGQTSSAAAIRAQQLGVPIVTLTPHSDITQTGPMVFQMFFSPQEEAEALVRAALSAGKHQLLSLYPNSPYGRAMASAFRDAVTASGANLVGEWAYVPGETSFSSYLAEINAPVDAVFLPDSARTISLAAPAIKASELKGASGAPPCVIAPSVGYDEDLVERAGRYLDGALFSRPFHLGEQGLAHTIDPTEPSFSIRFQNRFEQQPDVYSAYAFDAFNLIQRWTQGGASTRQDLAARLSSGAPSQTIGASGGLGTDRRSRVSTRIYELNAGVLRPVPDARLATPSAAPPERVRSGSPEP
ncbi:MAG: penicillin-binding protein activator [Myxococcota bacterium]